MPGEAIPERILGVAWLEASIYAALGGAFGGNIYCIPCAKMELNSIPQVFELAIVSPYGALLYTAAASLEQGNRTVALATVTSNRWQ